MLSALCSGNRALSGAALRLVGDGKSRDARARPGRRSRSDGLHKRLTASELDNDGGESGQEDTSGLREWVLPIWRLPRRGRLEDGFADCCGNDQPAATLAEVAPPVW